MGSKVDENKKIKRDALLENALELFLSKGLQETSIADIAKKAGVAKGTFYLYFKDKYDLRNILIAHEASKVFERAMKQLKKEDAANKKAGIPVSDEFEDRFIRLIDHVIDVMAADKRLLAFISKNLSWGYFKFALLNNRLENDVDFYALYESMIRESGCDFKTPEIMLFMIVELVSSTVYSCILYEEPVSVEEIKPYLFDTIRQIVRANRTDDSRTKNP